MDKLRHNRFFILLAFIFLFSCFGRRTDLNAEVFCPHIGQKILIQHITSEEFWEALHKFHEDRMKRGSSEDYTVLKFKNRYSMHLKGIKSEELFRCYVRDVTWEQVTSDYVLY